MILTLAPFIVSVPTERLILPRMLTVPAVKLIALAAVPPEQLSVLPEVPIEKVPVVLTVQVPITVKLAPGWL